MIVNYAKKTSRGLLSLEYVYYVSENGKNLTQRKQQVIL